MKKNMSTNSLRTFHHHHHCSSFKRLSTSMSLFLKLPSTTNTLSSSTSTTAATTNTLSSSTSTTAATTNTLSSSTSTTFSLPSSTISTTSQAISFDTLQHHLSTQNFRQADEETRRLLIVLAGESTQKRGYVFFSEVQFISETDLKAIDELWKEYSNNKFGYSVQKRLWQKANKDFTKLFIKLGWMKKLQTEIEQYNYKAFPDEFNWELNDETPEGHLPLTNALRGTRLFNCILSHQAFVGQEEMEIETSENGSVRDGTKPLLSNSFLKPDYSF